MKKHRFRRYLILAFALVMLMTMLPVSALAAETGTILGLGGPARTGDTRPVVLWIILMAVSAVAIVVLIVIMWVKRYKPKYYNKQKNNKKPKHK